VLVTFLCLPGFLRLQVESATEKLWVDQGSIANKRYKDAADMFGAGALWVRFLIQAKEKGQNAITVNAFKDTFSIVRDVFDIKSPAGYAYSDLCLRSPAGTCIGMGPLRFFNFNETVFESAVSTDKELLAAVSAERYPDMVSVRRDLIYGSIATEADGSQIVSAPVWRLDFWTQKN